MRGNSNKGSAGEPMSVVDTAWLRMDSTENLMVINSLFLFEEHFSRERFVALIKERLLSIPRFRMRSAIRGKHYCWEEPPEFDADYHITPVQLPETENAVAEEAALRDFVSGLISTPLDPQHPLWRYYHVDHYKGGTAVVLRIHHSYADGLALMAVLDAVADKSVMHSSPAARAGAGPVANSSNVVVRALQSALVGVGFGLGWLYEATRILFLSSDTRTAFKRPLTTQKQVAWAPSLNMDEVKQVGKAMGCTINDVLLGCVAGSMRQNLIKQGDSVDGVVIRAMVPFNLRPLSEAMELGNRFGLVFLDLPVGVADSIQQVKRVRQSMLKLKNGIQAMMSYNVLAILGVFSPAIERFALNFFSHKASAVMTNVPGPAEPVMMSGTKLVKPMFWVPQSGEIGMGVSILSYDNKVEFGLIADTALVENPQDVVEGFIDQYEQLKARVLTKGA
ncbi:MAG: wax ester/triacylglycerol synthase family O-acyltransferase [Gammaproteobacteria bacterium]|nr:MAG: wax ester/triacylglycerol synthase family O-acyltransferase [Gammaproteobacteria bacterium]